MPQPYTVEYSASKYALEGFFGGLRQEFTLTKKDITITMCTLGAIGKSSRVNLADQRRSWDLSTLKTFYFSLL